MHDEHLGMPWFGDVLSFEELFFHSFTFMHYLAEDATV